MTQNAIPDIPAELFPRHIALVMDGNGRWAQERGMPCTEGHRVGEKVLMDMVDACIEMGGVEWLSAYTFSTENWRRSREEVRFLMGFSREVMRAERDQLHAKNVRIVWVGRRPRLWRSVIRELEAAEEMTKNNTGLTLAMCINYGGRAELIDATRTIAQLASEGKLAPGEISEETLARFMYRPDMPDVDMFLRPSGSSGRRTSCCGSRRMRRWCTGTFSSRISPRKTSTMPCWSTRSGTAVSAARNSGTK